MKYDIIIIGAGAAGLAAAYHAIVQTPKLNIMVLEKEKIPGRKLNATGNGKCNLTNSDFQMDYYHADAKEFVMDWYDRNHYQKIITFFESLGILLYEKNGYYYPVSNQAKQVSSLLYEKSKSLGVNYQFESKVTDIKMITNKKETYYQIVSCSAEKQTCVYNTTHVIFATGGYASPKLGGCKDGYAIMKKFGLSCNEIYPVLSSVYVRDANLTLAKGVRLDASVTLKLHDGNIIKESGQIQLNDNNLSGIVMMNMSCYLNRYKEFIDSCSIHIDLMPQYTWDALKSFFATQKNMFPNETVENLLKGILPVPFISYITKRLNIDRRLNLDIMSEKQINRITSALKKLDFSPIYIEDFEKAQVTGGGVCTDEVYVDSFESKKYRNLYIVGEVLDVNGKCGGYNLTFAILSGISAINNIVNHKKCV